MSLGGTTKGKSFAASLGLLEKFQRFIENSDETIEKPIYTVDDILCMNQEIMSQQVTFKVHFGLNELRREYGLPPASKTIPWLSVWKEGFFTIQGLSGTKFCMSPHPLDPNNKLKPRSQWGADQIRIFLLAKVTFYCFNDEEEIVVGGYQWDPKYDIILILHFTII